jgi:FHA domain/Domain of unknown function (DUF1707)
MAGSSAEAPTTPDFIRASNEERDEAARELGERFAEGRLSHETFMQRMGTALGARDRHQLDRLLADLPPSRRAAGVVGGILAAVKVRSRRALDMLAAEKAALSGTIRREAAPRPGLAVKGPPAVLCFPPGTEKHYTIGRDPACDLLIGDLTVSRVHARLERDADGWMLADLGSTNGTRLNGWRVREPVRVRAGDRVCFGTARFIMRAGQRGGGHGPRSLRTP